MRNRTLRNGYWRNRYMRNGDENRLPKKPTNSACAGARPSRNSPVIAYSALCAEYSTSASGNHANPMNSTHNSPGAGARGHQRHSNASDNGR